MHLRIRLLIAALLLSQLLASSLTGQASEAEQSVPKERIAAWIDDLGSASYRTRVVASQRLLRVSGSAVPILESRLQKADLETTSGIVGVLMKLSASFDPRNSTEDKAWAALTRVSASGASSAASRAKFALEEVRLLRSNMAIEKLTDAGIFVGNGDVYLGSTSDDLLHIRIPQSWRGPSNTAYWLQWVQGIEVIVLEGDQISPETLSFAAKMQHLRILTIRDTHVSREHLAQLSNVPQLHHFQLVNVTSGDELVDSLGKLPVRRQLTLHGTDITIDGKQSLLELLPGIELSCRAGFLGVKCSNVFPRCEVSEVLPNSGAREGGVLPGDIITKFGEYPVSRFDDLQAAIGNHTAADKKIDLEVIRGNMPLTLQVKLKRTFP